MSEDTNYTYTCVEDVSDPSRMLCQMDSVAAPGPVGLCTSRHAGKPCIEFRRHHDGLSAYVKTTSASPEQIYKDCTMHSQSDKGFGADQFTVSCKDSAGIFIQKSGNVMLGWPATKSEGSQLKFFACDNTTGLCPP